MPSSYSSSVNALAEEFANMSSPKDDVGRVLKGAGADRSENFEFETLTLPDIRNNTRIVAVCGTPYTNDLASPALDGWFYSDFYLFNILFKGLGSEQLWLTPCDPEELVKRYGEYLHGSPFEPRQVVLNKKILQEKKITYPTRLPVDNTVERFLQILKSQASVAQTKKESLLIIICGHATPDYGVWLGDPELPDKEKRILKMEHVQEVLPEGLDVTVLSNACYSGGWAVNMNITAFAAAGPATKSESWTRSDTLKRRSGSIWCSMITQALQNEVQETAEAASIKTQPLSKEVQSKTQAAFTEACYNILHSRLDRFAARHKITFSAQDEGWEDAWTRRSGIPLANFRERFEALEVRASTMSADADTNRDPTRKRREMTESESGASLLNDEDFEIHDLLMNDMQTRFGSIEPARRKVVAHALQYRNSKPGRETLSSNTALEGRIQMIIDNNNVTWSKLSNTLRALEYRMSCTTAATLLLRACKIPLPKNQSCSEWDPDKHAMVVAYLNRQQELIYRAIFTMVVKARIFPQVLSTGQGFEFSKPLKYITSALYSAFSKAGKDVVQQKVQELIENRNEVLELQKGEVRGVPEVRTRKRRWAESIGIRRWTSPEKKKSGSSGDSTTPLSAKFINAPLLLPPSSGEETQGPYSEESSLSKGKEKGQRQ